MFPKLMPFRELGDGESGWDIQIHMDLSIMEGR